MNRGERARLLRIGCCLAVLGPASLARAQFRVETRVVLVDVTVTRNGPVPDLTKEDFELRVGGERTPFRMLEREELPVAVLFAMDVSGSTYGDRRRRLAGGARLFAEALTSRDTCGVVVVSMAARWLRDFEACGSEVGERLLQSAPGGATALWDGMILSLAALERPRGRPVLLVFTDAQDNLSWAREAHVRQAVAASEALVYAIVAPPPRVSRAVRPDSSGMELLEEVTSMTGGRVIRARSEETVEQAYQEVLRDLRVRYVLAFTPDPDEQGFVPIEVRVDRRRVTVRARRGFTARP